MNALRRLIAWWPLARPATPAAVPATHVEASPVEPRPLSHPFRPGDVAVYHYVSGDQVVFEVGRVWWSYLGPGPEPVPMVTEYATTPAGTPCQYHYRAAACELLQGDRS